MKKVFFVFVLLSTLVAHSASAAPNYYLLLERADKAYKSANYVDAISLYEQAYGKKQTYDVACRLAECYNNMKNYEKALMWSDRIVRYGNRTPFDEMRNLMLLLYNGKYNEVITTSRRFTSVMQEDLDFITACVDSARKWMANPHECKIVRLDTLNTVGADFGLIENPAKKGQLVFCSDGKYEHKEDEDIYRWTGRGYLKLYSFDGKKELLPFFGEGEQPEINIGPPCFSADGNEIFYAAVMKGREQISFNYKSEVKSKHLSIFSRKKGADGRWSDPIPFPYNAEDSYSMGDPWLTADGKRLYFVSDIPYGLGNTKILYSDRLADGSFSPPMDIDPGINTTYTERFPRFDSLGNFYFCSNGHPGMGGLDVFKVEVKDGVMGTPVNMGYPFNSAQDDFAPVFTSQYTGYLSSNRKGGEGEDDMYSFEFIQPHKRDTIAEVPLLAAREAEQLQIKEPTIEMQLGITDVHDTNVSFRLNNIYYEYDKSEVRADAAVELNKLIVLLRKYPKMVIEVQSHTDNRGTENYNKALSQKRAQAVASYITNRGIDANRVIPKGYGATKLVVKCGGMRRCTDADHMANRRTEFVILENNE